MHAIPWVGLRVLGLIFLLGQGLLDGVDLGATSVEEMTAAIGRSHDRWSVWLRYAQIVALVLATILFLPTLVRFGILRAPLVKRWLFDPLARALAARASESGVGSTRSWR